MHGSRNSRKLSYLSQEVCGGGLGQILFLSFINDLPDNIRYSVRRLANEVQCGQMSLYESDSVIE